MYRAEVILLSIIASHTSTEGNSMQQLNRRVTQRKEITELQGVSLCNSVKKLRVTLWLKILRIPVSTDGS